MARVVGRFETAVTPGAAIGEHHAAGFLQASIRVHQLRADQPGAGVLGKRVDQPIQPAGLRDGVVVEQYHVVAARQGDAVVAGGDETAIAGAPVVVQPLHLRQLRLRGIAAAVVHDDDLNLQQRRMRRQCAQACQRVRNVVVDRNHQRHARGVAVRNRKRGKRRGLRQPQRRAERHRRCLRMHANALPGGAPAACAHARHAAVNQPKHAIEQIACIGQ